MPHQHHCQVGIPSLYLPLTIFTVSYHLLWMDGRVTVATATDNDATGEALLPLVMVGRLNAEGGGWG